MPYGAVGELKVSVTTSLTRKQKIMEPGTKVVSDSKHKGKDEGDHGDKLEIPSHKLSSLLIPT